MSELASPGRGGVTALLPPGAPFPAVIEARSVTKRFPGIVAVDDLSLTIAPGEIVALLGQNGAGKSTFIQIVAGIHPPGSYEGAIAFEGRAYNPGSVADAETVGVALVPQEVNVAPDLSVAENMYLNAEPTRFGLIDRPLMIARARRVLEDFGLDVDPEAVMGSLTLSSQQLVIIARALSKNARLLILDEPTAALTEAESHRLFDRMRALRRQGVAIIFVSHRLTEVFEISDRIVILRDGKLAGIHETADVSRETVVTEMVGAVRTGAAVLPPAAPGATMLEVSGLTVAEPADPTRLRVHDASFAVARGEVVGLFGLLGAGCIEVALALYGAWQGPVSGRITFDGRAVDIPNPTAAVKLGMALMAQDRRDSLLLDHSVLDNAVLASLGALSHGGFLDLATGRRRTLDLVQQLDVKTRSIDTRVGTLSGGNQQKVQVARWLMADAKLLILIDPTRGVDVGARIEIKQVWADLRAAGRAIVVASTDSEELVDICDRVVVFRRGRIAGTLARDELSEERLLKMAADV
jgi:D-xylose transport system ATP-binding protein